MIQHLKVTQLMLQVLLEDLTSVSSTNFIQPKETGLVQLGGMI